METHPKTEGGFADNLQVTFPAFHAWAFSSTFETDAGIGVCSQPGDGLTPAAALPNNLAVAASWDPEVAFSGGQMIGNEARQHGFNIMLAGGINLCREPRNGRNFDMVAKTRCLQPLSLVRNCAAFNQTT